jgi:hypothetical protein
VLKLLRSPERRAALQRQAARYIETEHHPAVADRALQTAVESAMTHSAARPASADAAAAHRTRAQFIGHLQQAVGRALQTRGSSPQADTPPAPAQLTNQLRALVPWAIHRSRSAGVKRTAVYGAGSHTRIVLPIWRALGGPQATVIVVSGTPSEASCCGLPVISIDEFDPASVDGVLLSSQGFERAMAATCAEKLPGLPVISLWSPPAVAEASAVPFTHAVIPVAGTNAQALHR